MAPDIGVKMGVTGVAQFKQSMNQAQQSVKTLDAELKLNEKQLQATGDKTAYMQQKSKLLQQQIAAQNTVIKQGQQALAAMEKNGVAPASAAYQKMQRQVLEAQAALLDMQGGLNSVGSTAQETTQKTDKLADSLNGINKKVNFDAVLGGIGKITDGMEAAARRVEHLAGNIWNTMLEAAAWADDLGTEAELYGMSTEELQRRKQVSEIIQTPVEAMEKAKQKLNKNLHEMSDSTMETLQTLGFVVSGKFGEKAFTPKWLEADTTEKKLFKIGEALLSLNDEMQQSAIAQSLLGESWQTMLPLFNAGETKYNELLEAQNVVSQENVDRLADLSAKVKEMDSQWNTLKRTVEGEVAESFSTLAGAVGDVLRQFNEYLATPEGQQKLHDLGEALSSIFSDLTDTDVSGAVGLLGKALDQVTKGLRYIAEHKKEIVEGIQGIGIAFVGLKFAELLGGLVQGAAALKNLIGGGADAGASAGSATDGAETGTAGAVTAVSTGSKALDALGIGALLKTAFESSMELGTGLVGELFGNNKKKIVGTVESVIPAPTIPTSTQLRRSKGENLATASEESMQGHSVERTVEDIYDELYKAINDYDPDTNALNTTQMFDNILEPLIREATTQGGVIGDAADAIADLIYDKWIQSLFDDEWEGTTGGLLNILQDAINENAAGLKVETTPELPEDAVEQLQQKLSSCRLEVMVEPILGRMGASLGYSLGVDGFHANGLPFVPFDGYIAALHKGERIVPAEVNKSRTFTSNIYFDHTSLNNGIDAEGLAARISEANRRWAAGFGS